MDRRPTDFEAEVLANWDGVEDPGEPGKNPAHIWQKRLIPYTDHPTGLLLPQYKWPGILRSITSEESFKDYEREPWFFVIPPNPPPSPGLLPEKAEWMYVGGKYSDVQFARMLAKIAHGVIVWEVGIDNFRPFLKDIILGHDISKIWYYVGGNEQKFPPGHPHPYVEFAYGTFGKLSNVYVVQIRLFGNLGKTGDTEGAPIYFVVVGEDLPN